VHASHFGFEGRKFYFELNQGTMLTVSDLALVLVTAAFVLLLFRSLRPAQSRSSSNTSSRSQSSENAPAKASTPAAVKSAPESTGKAPAASEPPASSVSSQQDSGTLQSISNFI
jgi:hypothetical protein